MKATLKLPPSIPVLESALEGLTSANVALLESGNYPLSPLDAGVRYQKEATGLEEWNSCAETMKRGVGDCEDLNSWHAAGLRVSGEDEGARAAIIPTSRPGRYHCVVERSSGEIEDVCPALGMGQPPNHKVTGRVPAWSVQGTRTRTHKKGDIRERVNAARSKRSGRTSQEFNPAAEQQGSRSDEDPFREGMTERERAIDIDEQYDYEDEADYWGGASPWA